MLLWKTVNVADNERALVYRRNRLEIVLEPGHHRVSQLNGQIKIDRYHVSNIVIAQR